MIISWHLRAPFLQHSLQLLTCHLNLVGGGGAGLLWMDSLDADSLPAWHLMDPCAGSLLKMETALNPSTQRGKVFVDFLLG